MPRADIHYLEASSLLSADPCTLLGAVLSAGTGGASLILCNYGTATAVPLSSRVLPLYLASATGTTSMLYGDGIDLSAGLFVSMSSGGVASILWSARDR